LPNQCLNHLLHFHKRNYNRCLSYCFAQSKQKELIIILVVVVSLLQIYPKKVYQIPHCVRDDKLGYLTVWTRNGVELLSSPFNKRHIHCHVDSPAGGETSKPNIPKKGVAAPSFHPSPRGEGKRIGQNQIYLKKGVSDPSLRSG